MWVGTRRDVQTSQGRVQQYNGRDSVGPLSASVLFCHTSLETSELELSSLKSRTSWTGADGMLVRIITVPCSLKPRKQPKFKKTS